MGVAYRSRQVAVAFGESTETVTFQLRSVSSVTLRLEIFFSETIASAFFNYNKKVFSVFFLHHRRGFDCTLLIEANNSRINNETRERWA